LHVVPSLEIGRLQPSYAAYFAYTAGKKPPEKYNHRYDKTHFRRQDRPIGERSYAKKCRNTEEYRTKYGKNGCDYRRLHDPLVDLSVKHAIQD